MPPAIPFDPSVFRRSQDFCAATPTKKLLTKIPVRKPAPEWFIRTHTDPAYRFPTQVIELKEDRELYLVANVLADALDGEATLRSKLIVPAVNRQGALFLWPLGLPGPSGQTNPWHDSAREAADSRGNPVDSARLEYVRGLLRDHRRHRHVPGARIPRGSLAGANARIGVLRQNHQRPRSPHSSEVAW